MDNYISINNQRINLTDEQVEKIKDSFKISVCGMKLADVSAGETAKIGDHEMIVLEHTGDTTLLLLKGLLKEDQEFGTNNNYNGSYVDEICQEFAKEIAAIVGESNIILHDVDLTSDDGLKDYGTIQRYASLLTTDQARRYGCLVVACYSMEHACPRYHILGKMRFPVRPPQLRLLLQR